MLPAARIFGANASGKSDLLRAMDDMRRNVLYSFRHGDPEFEGPRSSFRLEPARRDAPSRFEVDLILHGIRHEYGFVIDDSGVLDEWAYRYPRGKAALLFRRERDNVTLGERNRAKGRAFVEILRPNSMLQAADLGSTEARVRELDPEVLERIKRATRIILGREEEPEDKDSEVDPRLPVTTRAGDYWMA